MFKNYDPGRIVVSFNGVVLQGFASGTFVKAERDNDTFSKVYGAHGDVGRVRSRKRGGKITITLMGISPSNDVLSGFVELGESAGLGDTGAIQIEDLQGTTLCHGTNGWVTRPANYEAGDDLSNREWVIDCDDLDMFIGGELV
jgi:hypothetical protein